MRGTTVGLSMAFVASLATAGWLWTELRSERARNSILVTQLEHPDGLHVTSATPAVTSPVSRVADALRSSAKPRESVASDEDPGRRWQEQRRRELEQERAMIKDPRFRAALVEQRRLTYAPRRANLIRLLNLAPAKVDSALELQINHELDVGDAMRSAGGDDQEDAEQAQKARQARIDALNSEYDAALDKLLGNDKRNQLQSYMESRRSRMQVDSLRSELGEANALRDDQVEPMVSALHTERAKMDSDLEEMQKEEPSARSAQELNEFSRRYNEKQIALTKEMNARMHAGASSILTNGQLEILDAQLARDLARLEAQQRMNAVQTKLQSASAEPN